MDSIIYAEFTDELFEEWFKLNCNVEFSSVEKQDAFKRYIRDMIELKHNEKIRKEQRLCSLCNYINSPHEIEINGQNIGFYCEKCNIAHGNLVEIHVVMQWEGRAKIESNYLNFANAFDNCDKLFK